MKHPEIQSRSLAGLQVPPVGMGTWSTFDVVSPEDIAVRQTIIQSCIDSGVSFLDTSPMYRESERVLGITTEGHRAHVQLATKVWCSGKSEGQAQIRRSFNLLKADYIDVLQIHNLVDWQTHLPILEQMKAEGKIGQIGITHYQVSQCPEMMRIMKTRRVDTIQIPYNIFERTCERDILPLAADLGLGVIAMKPLGVGHLAKNLKGAPDLTPLNALGITTWSQALLAWILADLRISVVIPATSRPEHLTENAAVNTVLPLPGDLRTYVQKEAERCVG